LDLTLLGFEAF